MANGDHFEQLMEEGFAQLPQWVREKIDNVAVLIEDEPSEEDRRAQGLADDETLLGLYKGVPLSERGELYGIGGTIPDTITLYRLPIEEAALDELENMGFVNPYLDLRNPRHREVVQKIVTETIWHEFAHHFGMDEDEVRRREGERGVV